MIRITQTTVLSDPADIPRLAEEFAETGCARLPGFLTQPVLGYLLDWLEATQFEERNEVGHGGVFGTTLSVPDTERSLFLLHFILNRREIYDIVGKVAGCPKIGNFMGRLHRTIGGTDQHIDWHRDAVEARVLGLTINLSTEDYVGGLFQLRDPEETIRAEVGPAAPGDAFLFRIDREWKHRLTRVESGRRTVGVGWFRTEPEWEKYALNATRASRILIAGEKLCDKYP